ncbi:hypothetical protein [Chondromyces crocatus]|uniref:DUF3857 domain-containing protein n=1 Tax=Chondromyces crocatus TaxID=52 RepID=A0A0K1E676_CHOCO|nr:hypothetical protein [Chondromyces crocatus]AKT36380.1 uncharacterized protein CMC5_004930 [Chondromyces crocatus]
MAPALVALLSGASSVACTPPAVAPSTGGSVLSDGFAAAMEAEARSSVEVGPYLELLDRAAAAPQMEDALAATLAAIDALTVGASPTVDTSPGGAVFRSMETLPTVVSRLGHAWALAGKHGKGAPAMPFMRGAIAGALHRIALFVGDEQAAMTWGSRRGCAQDAAVVGPLDWTSLRGLEGRSPVGTLAEPLDGSYPGVAPFAEKVAPLRVRADMCEIDTNAVSFLQGTRAAVVDLYVPAPQRIALALTSSSAAVVDVGGVTALRRGYEAGGLPVTRMASLHVEGGWVRVVVRVAQKNDGGGIELGAWDAQGTPLRTRAPAPGQVAGARASKAQAIEVGPPAGADDPKLALRVAALLGVGEARQAEHLLEARLEVSAGASKDAPPDPRLDLLYARSLPIAGDLPDVKVAERLSSVSTRLGKAWPWSWEARLLAAELADRRLGEGEGVIEALDRLGVTAQAEGPTKDALPLVADVDRVVLARAAMMAQRAGMPDASEMAYKRLTAIAKGSAVLANVDDALHGRVGGDAVKVRCSGAGRDRSDRACLDALREAQAYDRALTELSRLRRLRRAPHALQNVELGIQVARGDLKAALKVHDAMPPAERRLLDALGVAAGRNDGGAVRGRLARDRSTARDAPHAVGVLQRALGLSPDVAPALEAEGRKLVLADQKAPAVPGAATLVLRHLERFEIATDGLLHYVAYDLRRVSGTTDVAMGAGAYGPLIEGRGNPRLLRRRIHKKDGRILTPDAAAFAAQAHSDLSQLEQGDYVEQILEGYTLPSDTGQLVIDTTDLMPDRTSVREAEFEVRRPASVDLQQWAHPLLGEPEERTEKDVAVTVWRVKDLAPRRIEDGVPRMEQGVGISIGTQTWANVGRAIGENLRSLEDRDPYVARWAAEAAGADKTPSPALVERVVAAVGKAVKVADSAELSDIAAIYGGGSQRTTARTILELGHGSRSWVIFRALRELGVKAELAIAEMEPFSASSEFPAHVGRFRHPLVIAHLGGKAGDVWIDADVEGPPLPPGRVSPELRGRAAMFSDGRMVTVQAAGADANDEVDLRLVVDARGDARGHFTILLRGRAAQSLSEAFETVVGTDRREMLRDVVLGWVPWADVEDVTVSSRQGSWEVALRAEVAIHGFARPEGRGGTTWTLPGIEPVHFSFPRGFAGTLGATYASRGARQSALSIDTTLQYHVRRRIELPEGMEVSRAPAEVAVDDARLAARRKGTYGAVIEEDFSMSLPTGTVPAGEYQAFVGRVQAIDSGFMAGIRVVSRGGAAETAKAPAKAGASATPAPKTPTSPGATRPKGAR